MKKNTIYVFVVILMQFYVVSCSNLPPMQNVVNTAPPAIVNKYGEIDKSDKFIKEVYFGTSRIDKCETSLVDCNSTDRYNTENYKTATKLSYGKIFVKIPFIKKFGTNTGMSVNSIVNYKNSVDFKKDIDSSDTFIYIHGFNTSFNDASIRCAQLAHDLNYNGKPILFSWPSGNDGPLGYKKDKKRARENTLLLVEFLEKISSNNNKKIHIIAHSMGSLVLMNALSEISTNMKDKNYLKSRRSTNNKLFNQIVFAASDVDRNNFVNNFNNFDFKSLANGFTLYTTNNDGPLMMSQYINYFDEGGNPRLGNLRKIELVSGTDTVDGRFAVDNQLLGHSYYAEDHGFLSDLFLLLKYEEKPENRLLVNAITTSGEKIWFIKP